jgi:hypothetical protein
MIGSYLLPEAMFFRGVAIQSTSGGERIA